MMRRRLPSVVLVVVAELTAITGVTAMATWAAPACFGEPATIVGTKGDDELMGTRADDVIVALGGSDRVVGGAGDDRICAGGREDYVRGGAGRDRVLASGGSDTVHGGPGSDTILTGAGSVEALFGGSGDDRLSAGAGSFDGLIGGAGDDILDGGSGRDIAFFFDSPTGISADLDTDRAIGFGHDRLRRIEGLGGSNHDDELAGDDASNLIVAQKGDDVVDARGSGTLEGLGADQLDGGAGDDTLIGGPGADIVTYEDARGPIDLDLELGTASGSGSDALSGIEAGIGSFFDDTLRGDGTDNAFVGGEGNDTIDGRGGRDQAAYFDAPVPIDADLALGLATGWGTDTLAAIEDVTGSAFDDVLSGDVAPNAIEGGSGRDHLAGRDGDDVLLGGRGTDDADGGSGIDACDAETEVACESDPASRMPTRFGWLAAPSVPYSPAGRSRSQLAVTTILGASTRPGRFR